jgi:hypothetical protein
MAQASTLSVGLDVPKDSLAVAYVATEHGAAVVYGGTIGPRHGDLDKRSRNLQSKATQLLFVYAAGPCGSWLDRELRKSGDDCWGVAPPLMPQKAGARVKTARHDAGQLARLLRSGDLTPVYVLAWRTEPSATCAGLVKTSFGASRPPRSVSQRFGCGTTSATQARPPGVRLTCAGSWQGSVRLPRRRSSSRKMAGR